MDLAFKVDLSGLKQGLDQVQRQQLPFAAAQALTAVAGHAGLGWQAEMREKLDRPTPFTVNAVTVLAARKANLTATVLVKDVAAQYLEPFVDGGVHFLGAKRGLLTPKNVSLNAYGNLTKRQLANLKARPDVFIGPVTLKSGEVVNGVWQRLGSQGSPGRGGAKSSRMGGGRQGRALKLLIRFTDPQPVRQRLAFADRVNAAIQQHLQPEFAKALARAMATAH